jgi:uncharacterized membrane protein
MHVKKNKKMQLVFVKVLWVRYPNQGRWCVYILDIQVQESISRGGVQHGLNTYKPT